MQIFHQSVFERWPLEDKSVQAIITSPPYYALRKYDIPDVIIGGKQDCKHNWQMPERKPSGGKGLNANTIANRLLEDNLRDGSYFSNFCTYCNAWKGQHGLEPDFMLYLAHCKLWMQEAIRVLRDDGVIFVNLADSYNGSGKGVGTKLEQVNSLQKNNIGSFIQTYTKINNYPCKTKLLIPERFAIMCVDELNLILRNTIIWYSPNKMPESVTDRFSKKYEYIFMFTKKPKYYFNLDAVKIPSKTYEYDKRCSAIRNARKEEYHKKVKVRLNATTKINEEDAESCSSPRARLHRLTYNGKSEATSTFLASQPYCNPGDVFVVNTQPSSYKHYAMWPEKLVRLMVLCSTKEGDVVLDPFCGSGTTVKVAEELNRIGKGIDLGYQDIQKHRLSEIQKVLFT